MTEKPRSSGVAQHFLSTRDGPFRLLHTQCATAYFAKLRGGVERFVTVYPCQINGGLAQPRELEQSLSRSRDLAFNRAGARVAGTVPAEVLQWKDAIVTVGPLDTDCVAPDFVQASNSRRCL